MEHATVSWVVKMIEGIVALCLGSSVRVTWLDQVNAAAHSDDDHIYLPNPSGEDAQQYERLLMVTLREVEKHYRAKLAAGSPDTSPEALVYAFALDEARIKTAMAQTFMAVAAMLAAVANQAGETQPTMGDEPGPQQQGSQETPLPKETASSPPQGGDSGASAEGQCDGDGNVAEGVDPDQAGEAPTGAAPTGVSQGAESEAASKGDGDPSTSPDPQGDGGGGNSPQAPISTDEEIVGARAVKDDDAEPSVALETQAVEPEQAAAAAEPVGECKGPVLAPGEVPEMTVAPDPSREHQERVAEMSSTDLAETDAGPNQDVTALLCETGGGELVQCRAAEANSLLSGVSGHLVGVLLREFQDRRRRPFLRASSGRDLAIAHAWKFKQLGDSAVFRRKSLACGVDAAVSILLDTSGSMRSRMAQAANVTYALALAFQRIPGVQTSVDVFPGPGVPFEEVLQFKQNINSAKGRLEMVEAGGGTPTGSAMQARLPKLLATRAEKKVVIVVTDGQPNYGDEQSLTHAVVGEAARHGVTVIGIGINAEVGDYFAHHVDVESVDDLASALDALFKGELAALLAA